MMYARLNEAVERRLDGLVKQALGKGWQERTSQVLKEALDSLTWHVQDYIAGDLEQNLATHIADAARRTAEDFLERLAKGDEQAVAQFLSLPNDYYDERKRFHWLDYGREFGGMALRRKMIEAVQDRLEREVLLDQAAQIKVLGEQVQKQEAELRLWRTGEKTTRENW